MFHAFHAVVVACNEREKIIISAFIIRGEVVIIHVKRRVECGTESIEEKKLLSKQDSMPRVTADENENNNNNKEDSVALLLNEKK